MSQNTSLPISSRTSRLNSLIVNRPESLSKEQKEICRAINREGLLDALFLLYDECSKDALKKRNKNIQDFATKCMLTKMAFFSCDYLIIFIIPNLFILLRHLFTDRPIIRETKQLRVSLNDFNIKSRIGHGYFGEVDVRKKFNLN